MFIKKQVRSNKEKRVTDRQTDGWTDPQRDACTHPKMCRLSNEFYTLSSRYLVIFHGHRWSITGLSFGLPSAGVDWDRGGESGSRAWAGDILSVFLPARALCLDSPLSPFTTFTLLNTCISFNWAKTQRDILHFLPSRSVVQLLILWQRMCGSKKGNKWTGKIR